MKSLIRMDWHRAIRRSCVIIMVAFLALAAFSGMFELYSYSRDYISTNEFETIEMYNLEPEEELIRLRAVFKQVWAETMNANGNIAGMFMAILMGLYIGSDFTKGRIRESIAAGYSRTSIFWAKYAVLSVLCTVAFLVFGIVHFMNRPDVFAGYVEGGDFLFFLYYFVWAIPACLSLAAMALSIAFLVRRPVPAALATLIVFTLRKKLVGMVVNMLTGGEAVELFKPFRTAEFWPHYDFAMLALNVALAVVFVVVALIVFKKKDVK